MSDPSVPSTSNTATRKRIRKEKKEDVIKIKKARGVEHVNHKNKTVPARQTGPNCRCKKYECFNKISADKRINLLTSFNDLGNKNDQDAYLMGLITCAPTNRHTVENPTVFRFSTFKYKIRQGLCETPVCLSAFCSIHGITKGRVRRLQVLLGANILSPKDQRGKHRENRYKKTPEEVLHLIQNHISSFKARQSHYSRKDNPHCFYLPEELTVQKMHALFLESFYINVSYMVYWTVFKKEFNLKFGLPRTDTCATCDNLNLKIKCAALPQTVEILKTEHTLHLSKAEKFTEIKNAQKMKAQQGEIMCLSFDYMQNLPLPHIRTSDVFYSRQLWNFVFGIHDLGKNTVLMNSYLETEGKKGQNDVTSLLFHYLNEHDIYSEHLVLLSDGCSGQNKNYVMVHFLYALVHVLCLFKSIKYIYPIRGHTFLPNDQDFSLIGNIKKKCTAETHEDWNQVIITARKHPSPFEVKKVTHDTFFNVKQALDPYFLRQSKPPMQIKKIRMLKIEKDYPFVLVRYNFTGPWQRIYIRNKRLLPTELNFQPLYHTSLPLNQNKVNDIKKLTKYLSSPSKLEFYDKIFENCNLNDINDDHTDCDDEDNSSGE